MSKMFCPNLLPALPLTTQDLMEASNFFAKVWLLLSP